MMPAPATATNATGKYGNGSSATDGTYGSGGGPFREGRSAAIKFWCRPSSMASTCAVDEAGSGYANRNAGSLPK